MACRRSATTSGSMSNMSRPTRPGRCTWAIAAARWSATRWRGCSRRRASASPRNIMSTTPAAQVDTLARSVHLRYREALGEDIGEIPEGLYPGDYLEPVGALLAAEFGDRFADAPESEWLRAVPHADGRGDARPDPPRPRAARHPSRHVRVRGRAAGVGRGRARRWQMLRAKGLVYEGELERPKSLDEHDEWEPVELTLFRSTQFGDDQDRPMKKSDGSWTYFGADAAYHLQKARERRPSGQHLGRRPCRDGQARPGGGQGADRRPRRPRRQDRPDGPAVPRRRADQDVASASGNFVTLADVVERSRQGRRPLHDADQARRHAARLRLRQGGRGVEGQSGVLRPICPCADQLAEAQGGGRGRRPRRARRTSACSTTRSWRWSSTAAQYPRVVESGGDGP